MPIKIDIQKLKQLIFFSGILFSLLLFLLFLLSPVKKGGFSIFEINSQILSLEFAQNSEQIHEIFGKMGDSGFEFRVNRFTKILGLDYFFIFIYSFFILTLVEFLAFNGNKNTAKLKCLNYILILSLIIFNFTQNIFLGNILDSNLNRIPQFYLDNLRIFTMLKWNSFLLMTFLIGIFLWKSEISKSSRFLSIPLIANIAFMPFFNFFPNLIEINLFISIFFVFSIWLKFCYSWITEGQISLSLFHSKLN